MSRIASDLEVLHGRWAFLFCEHKRHCGFHCRALRLLTVVRSPHLHLHFYLSSFIVTATTKGSYYSCCCYHYNYLRGDYWKPAAKLSLSLTLSSPVCHIDYPFRFYPLWAPQPFCLPYWLAILLLSTMGPSTFFFTILISYSVFIHYRSHQPSCLPYWSVLLFLYTKGPISPIFYHID